MSLYQILDYACKYWGRTLRKQLSCDKLDKILAVNNNNK